MKSTLAIISGLLALSVSAHPAESHHLHGRALADLSRYASKITSSFVQAADIPANIKTTAAPDYVQSATNLVKALFPSATFRLIDDHYTHDNGLSFINFKQTAHGRDIDDANFHVNVKQDGSILSYGHSFFTGTVPTVDIVSLVGLIEPAGNAGAFTLNSVDGVLSQPKADLIYMQSPTNKKILIPTWRVETDIGENWLLSYVNAVGTGEIVSVTNYVAHATYDVLRYPLNNPSVGSRSLVKNPENYTASPDGWLKSVNTVYNVTRGNSGVAQYAPQGTATNYNTAPKPVAIKGVFDEYYSSGLYYPSSYANASAVQLFYSANKIHDILYILGFNERISTSARGGYSGDFVVLNTQDGTGQNNAYFASPPDGQAARMAMFVFTYTKPPRDSSFDLDIVWHEYAHGLSNRLTGGAGNSGCLTTLESRGLGEGWSDFYAYAARINYYDNRYTNYAQGDWSYGKSAGSRPYLYSNSRATNPQTLSYLNRYNEEHDIGSVWASILYGVIWNLIDVHGNSFTTDYPNLDRNGTPSDGRYLAMKLVLEGMRIQPCNPTFLQARDAIINADTQQTSGANYCTLYSGFAARGLGINAYVNNNGQYVDGYDLPFSCGNEK